MENRFVILIAEDREIISEQTKNSIIDKGINAEIIQTSNGQDTIDKILEYKPTMIILGNRMPKMTGLEVLKYIKEKGIKLPLAFMITGDWYIETESKKLGVSKFFRKPFLYEDLADEVEKVYLALAS